MMDKLWSLGKRYITSSAAVFGLSFALSVLTSCKGKPEVQQTQPPLLSIAQEGGKTTAIPQNELSSLVQKGDFEKMRTLICGKDGCSGELQTYKGELTFNTLVILTNIMILFKKLDGALTTLCGVAGSQLGAICGAPEVSALTPTIRIDTKQTNVIDTLLGLVGLKREEITTLMQEVSVATSNYIEKGDKNFVMKLTVPFVAKIGNLVDVRFKAGTEIRWDLITILGSVSQLVSALFNVINAHNWELDIQPIISNASQLLSDLQSDIPGFLRRVPGTLGIDKAPNFLRFAQGGETYWKAIPSNISKALTWAGDGLDYFFKNPCTGGDMNLVCWDSNKASLRFNLDSQYKNKFMGGDATGELKLPAGFSDKTAEQIVAVMRSGGKKFDCQQQDNLLKVVGANDEFDIIKIVNAILSLSQGSITEVSGIPNFLRIDVCKIMGVKGANPVSLRDLIFPAELNWSGGKWVYAQAGTQFAIEFEAPRNFYFKAITAGNRGDNKLLEIGIDPSEFLVITNEFYENNVSDSFPFVRSITYAGSATEFYAELITTYGTIQIWSLYVAQGVKWKRFDLVKVKSGDFLYLIENLIIDKISPLIPASSLGVPNETLGLIVYKDWVRKWYVARGDGNRFEGIYKDDKPLTVVRDWIEPMTFYLTDVTHWFSKYPADVMPSSLDEVLGIGLKNIPYILFRDRDGIVFNGAVEVDNCSIIVEYAKTLSGAFQGGKITKEKYDSYVNFILSPFVIERVVGYTYKSFVKQLAGMGNPEPVSDIVKYMGDCELTPDKLGADVARLSHTPQWKGATNQAVSDLIALLVFGLRARSVIE